MKYKETAADALSALCEERGLTYRQVGAEIGKSKSGIAKWIYKNHIPIGEILRLCEHFDMQISDFIKETT